jgi:hypothetical protein
MVSFGALSLRCHFLAARCLGIGPRHTRKTRKGKNRLRKARDGRNHPCCRRQWEVFGVRGKSEARRRFSRQRFGSHSVFGDGVAELRPPITFRVSMRRFGRLELRALRACSEQSGVALSLPPQSKRDQGFLIIFVSFRVFRGQEFLRPTHVPVPDCDLAGAS